MGKPYGNTAFKRRKLNSVQRSWPALKSGCHSGAGNNWHLIVVDECQQLRVLSAQLLQHGLQDGGVPLHHLPQPLKLGIVAQEGQRRTPAPTAAALLQSHLSLSPPDPHFPPGTACPTLFSKHGAKQSIYQHAGPHVLLQQKKDAWIKPESITTLRGPTSVPYLHKLAQKRYIGVRRTQTRNTALSTCWNMSSGCVLGPALGAADAAGAVEDEGVAAAPPLPAASPGVAHYQYTAALHLNEG